MARASSLGSPENSAGTADRTEIQILVETLLDEKACFVIRKNFQNPFRTPRDKSFWRSFRDPAPEEHAYEALTRVQHLEEKQ